MQQANYENICKVNSKLCLFFKYVAVVYVNDTEAHYINYKVKNDDRKPTYGMYTLFVCLNISNWW